MRERGDEHAREHHVRSDQELGQTESRLREADGHLHGLHSEEAEDGADETVLAMAGESHLPHLRATAERASALIHGYLEPDVAADDAQSAIDALFD